MTKTKKQTKRRKGQPTSKARLSSELLYAVMVLNSTLEITAFGRNEKIKLSYAGGMVGDIPVFKSRAAAAAYAGGKYDIQVISAKEPNGVLY